MKQYKQGDVVIALEDIEDLFKISHKSYAVKGKKGIVLYAEEGFCTVSFYGFKEGIKYDTHIILDNGNAIYIDEYSVVEIYDLESIMTENEIEKYNDQVEKYEKNPLLDKDKYTLSRDFNDFNSSTEVVRYFKNMKNELERRKERKIPSAISIRSGSVMPQFIDCDFRYNQGRVAFDLNINIKNKSINRFKNFINIENKNYLQYRLSSSDNYHMLCILDNTKTYGVETIQFCKVDEDDESTIYKTSIIVHSWNPSLTRNYYNRIVNKLVLINNEGEKLEIDFSNENPLDF